MAKGAEGKQKLLNKFIQAVGDDYIGEYDKKYYFWTSENGEKIQIAVSMTHPKNYVSTLDNNIGGDFNFEEDEITEARPIKFEPAEITQEEHDKVAELIAKLGL